MTGVSDPQVPEPDWVAQTLLTAVTSGFSIAHEPRLVRKRFEEQLRALVDARSIVVRDCPAGALAHPDVLAIDVPAPPGSGPTRLEAVFEPSQPIDDWKRRTLAVGAHVAALLVELEHADGRWARLRRRPDGAAPLIGSSLAIRSVRERIERVAVTDFTVLIEGGLGPEPHPGFIAVSGQVAFSGSAGQMEGAEVWKVKGSASKGRRGGGERTRAWTVIGRVELAEMQSHLGPMLLRAPPIELAVGTSPTLRPDHPT